MALPLVILYHFCPISPMIYHRENRNRSIKKKAKYFLKNCFAILFHYIQEYWKPPSFSLFNFVRVTSALRTLVHLNHLIGSWGEKSVQIDSQKTALLTLALCQTAIFRSKCRKHVKFEKEQKQETFEGSNWITSPNF